MTEEIEGVVRAALERWAQAAHHLAQARKSHLSSPAIREREFVLVAHASGRLTVGLSSDEGELRGIELGGDLRRSTCDPAHIHHYHYVWGGKGLRGPELVITAARGQPRLILRAVRQLEAATAWCNARVAGLERADAELHRQQARVVEVLQAMADLAEVAR
jgi:hypothetical protein